LQSNKAKAYTEGGQGGSTPTPVTGVGRCPPPPKKKLRAFTLFLNLKLKSEEHKKISLLFFFLVVLFEGEIK